MKEFPCNRSDSLFHFVSYARRYVIGCLFTMQYREYVVVGRVGSYYCVYYNAINAYYLVGKYQNSIRSFWPAWYPEKSCVYFISSCVNYKFNLLTCQPPVKEEWLIQKTSILTKNKKKNKHIICLPTYLSRYKLFLQFCFSTVVWEVTNSTQKDDKDKNVKFGIVMLLSC